MKFVLALLTCVCVMPLLSGCGPGLEIKPPNIPLRLAPSPELTETTTEVIAVVNQAAESAGLPPLLLLSSSGVPVTETDRADVCGLCVSDDSGTPTAIMVRTGCGHSDIVLIHEIGHALGLARTSHYGDPDSIMYSKLRTVWTAEQAARSLVEALISPSLGEEAKK